MAHEQTVCSLTKATDTYTEYNNFYTDAPNVISHEHYLSCYSAAIPQQVTSRKILCPRRCNSSFLAHTELVFGQKRDQYHLHLHQSKPHSEYILILAKSGSHSYGRFVYVFQL